jgi:hypothetical protein
MAVPPSGVVIWKLSVGTFLTMSAKTLKLAAPRGMSMWLARLRGLPVSASSAARKSSKRRLISSATACSSSARRTTLILPHSPFSAARPAATAASTSAWPASCTRPTTSLVAGLRSSKVLPVATNSPLMKFRNCFMADVA